MSVMNQMEPRHKFQQLLQFTGQDGKRVEFRRSVVADDQNICPVEELHQIGRDLNKLILQIRKQTNQCRESITVVQNCIRATSEKVTNITNSCLWESKRCP